MCRSTVETLYELHGEKVVLVSHSYGESVSRAFYTWAEADDPGWVEKHLEALVNIAGPTLVRRRVWGGGIAGKGKQVTYVGLGGEALGVSDQHRRAHAGEEGSLLGGRREVWEEK